MYGLDESGRVWYFTIARVLKELGCQNVHNDFAMFFYKKDDTLHGIISLHVDDGIYCGSQVFYDTILFEVFWIQSIDITDILVHKQGKHQRIQNNTSWL